MVQDWYAGKALEYGWSRNILTMQIDTQAHTRSGIAVTNFEARLSPPQSDLVREVPKGPYVSDFLELTEWMFLRLGCEYRLHGERNR
ncbi:YhcG family protein [Burkholderia mayonis]|uniref:Uncharacterized protein n=1 Tax=Burkholderia mayonis TaxID=1385591 RepID=A0A1B4FTH6_9BURK|nr:YhcG family protein [Burkholderia mayonis]AOJ06980.1 hypothetical protein WS71_06400 [Burkholderia mayonis]KVE52665.1 hypothetical protein WS71_09020 [Burkholderia mayonis]